MQGEMVLHKLCKGRKNNDRIMTRSKKVLTRSEILDIIEVLIVIIQL